MTELFVLPKAQMHGVPPGISMREKLHSELKYFGSNFEVGRKLAEASEERLFFRWSSMAKMWMVPLLLEAQRRLESELKLNQ